MMTKRVMRKVIKTIIKVRIKAIIVMMKTKKKKIIVMKKAKKRKVNKVKVIRKNLRMMTMTLIRMIVMRYLSTLCFITLI